MAEGAVGIELSARLEGRKVIWICRLRRCVQRMRKFRLKHQDSIYRRFQTREEFRFALSARLTLDAIIRRRTIGRKRKSISIRDA